LRDTAHPPPKAWFLLLWTCDRMTHAPRIDTNYRLRERLGCCELGIMRMTTRVAQPSEAAQGNWGTYWGSQWGTPQFLCLLSHCSCRSMNNLGVVAERVGFEPWRRHYGFYGRHIPVSSWSVAGAALLMLEGDPLSHLRAM
jgi:hypothetical protein